MIVIFNPAVVTIFAFYNYDLNVYIYNLSKDIFCLFIIQINTRVQKIHLHIIIKRMCMCINTYKFAYNYEIN